jgi:hypothetical protein
LTSPSQISITTWSSCLCVFSSKKLSRLYTPCMMHSSRSDTLRGAPRSPQYAGYCDGVAPWGYKFILYLMPIVISHHLFYLLLGFFSFLSSANHQWRIKNTSSVSTLLPQRDVICLTMQKLQRRCHPDLRLHRGTHQMSHRTAAAHQCLSRAVPRGRAQ